MDKSDCLLISRHPDNKADNRVSWQISRPTIVVRITPISHSVLISGGIANCIRAERFVKCVWMNSCLGFWLFEFGLVIVFTHILTPPINHRSLARPSPTPGLLRRNTSDVWAGGLWRERGRNQLPTTSDASRQATVSGRVSEGYLVCRALSAFCLLNSWTITETGNKCRCWYKWRICDSSCWVSSHQCLFPKQSTLSSGSRECAWPGRQSGVSGHWGRNAGVSWWSEQWREATLTPVRAVSQSESEWPLQTAASGEQWSQPAESCGEWPWCDHNIQSPESRAWSDGHQWEGADHPDLVRGSLCQPGTEDWVRTEDWRLRTLPRNILQTVCCRGCWGQKQSEKLEHCGYWLQVRLWLIQCKESVL